ncbi:acyl-CoA:6-aminopenicillanic acid acyl transferase [Pseudonocardia hierapolitana]|uniref:Acyl-CoA:6-aminopenicillanic acid acyl transferase n=1 Tax=Pseudonocardia hierapolitana TaxID=1128676 RepID=A0A561SUD4_9PSEU|nr:C45 family peptidase [Pseudonocardia hierapolitana]TWF78472.1 acyl-CoA:6-aminopenicillanic acid acyl transferase [Pseudonocardia hierapolitana]
MTVTTEIVAGGSADFMTVRHVVASGRQADIGRALALEAQRAYGWTPAPADPVKARARRAWFARHWPQHLARMRGAAQALGLDPDTDEVHLDGAGGIPLGSACSASYYPPAVTADGRGVLGRNYDFFTTSATELFAMLAGGHSAPSDEMPLSARPYVITTVPDDGPATTVLTMNELDGCMEGINEHGLAAVFNLADAENTSGPVDAGPQVGVSSSQLLRFLLDTCRTVEEAKAALLGAKQYDLGVSLHYLVADPSGAAFVWERGPGGDEHIVEAAGGALCMTNHPLHRHRDQAALPEDTDEALLTYQRYRTIADRSAGAGLSAARMREALDAVRVDAATDTPYPVRTLWRTVFDLESRTMATHFYLGDAPDGSPRYSPERAFPIPAQQPA